MSTVPGLDDQLAQQLAVYTAALGALVGAVLRADPGLIEDAAQHLERHASRSPHRQAAQLLRDDLATFRQVRST
jgi:hypothetical protein